MVALFMVEDQNGDLVDILYYHDWCKTKESKFWPAHEDMDYPVYCEKCGSRIESIGLTEYGEEYEKEHSTEVTY